MAYKPITYPKKTTGEQLREDIIFMAIGIFILWLVGKVINFIFKPLRNITNEELDKQVLVKQEARKDRLEKINNNINDPMYQVHLRLIDDPKKYKKDPDTEVYKEWFEEYKKGNILDSTLKWVPEMYIGEDINPNFIQYMKIQLDLHKKSNIINRFKFINTIRKYYPEFNSNFKDLEKDIAYYDSGIKEDNLRGEIKKEIKKNGLSDELSEYLANKDISSEKLKLLIGKFKEYKKLGYEDETCIYAIENNIKDKDIEIIHTVVENIGLPHRVGLAFVKKELTIDNLEELKESMDDIVNNYGSDIYSTLDNGKVVYDDFLDEYLKRYRQKKVLRS